MRWQKSTAVALEYSWVAGDSSEVAMSPLVTYGRAISR